MRSSFSNKQIMQANQGSTKALHVLTFLFPFSIISMHQTEWNETITAHNYTIFVISHSHIERYKKKIVCIVRN